MILLSRIKDERGLTLIEVLIVVTILTVLLSLLIPNIVASSRKAEEKVCYSTQMMVEGQIALYELDQRKKVDGQTTEAIFNELIVHGYLKEKPACPAGGKYSWDATNKKLTCDEHGHHSGETGNGS